MLYNPSVIFQCLSTQATYINKVYGQMFYFIDKGQLYVDTQNRGRILATDVYIIDFERERTNFVPDNRSTMATEPNAITNDQIYSDYIYAYVVETNCLYAYYYSSKTWQIIYGKYGTTTVAQTYLPNGNAVIINADDVTTNGILNDGSVVIRDTNKMICGLVKSDGYSLYLQSLVGGQINIEPSSTPSGDGCLQLNSETYDTNLNNNLIVFGDIKTTDKSNWSKQYRLMIQDVNIISTTTIKQGSTLIAGSSLGDDKYTEDTKLTEDVTVTSGLILTNSRIYINSTINGVVLTPPYLFDLDDEDVTTLPHSVIFDKSSGSDSILTLPFNCPFENAGDSCFVKNIDGITTIKTVKFKDEKQFDVEYVAAATSIKSSMHIIYSFDNKVKILP